MNNEFVSYEIALELKELGFDEECLFCFYGKSDLSNFKESDYELCGDRHNSSFKEDGRVSAPLYQQVFRWFREKHSLFHSIDPLGYNMCLGLVGQLGKLKPCNVPNYGTYEEAQKECILDLISIIKNKTK
jgi:hypothetical protein